jgi:hypothetical protein
LTVVNAPTAQRGHHCSLYAEGEKTQKDNPMMTRLFASALLVVGLSQAALAQTSTQQNQRSGAAENTQAPENLPQELRQKLTSSGFTDVKVVPSSFVVSAKDKDGRPVMMRITPTSMTVLTELPVSNTPTTGAGSDSSTNPGQSR